MNYTRALRLVAVFSACVMLLVAFGYARTPSAATTPFASPAFGAAWSPVDEPVASGAVQRAWVWGAGPSSAGIAEPYHDAPGGNRLVQYFCKARMERTDPPHPPVATSLLSPRLVTW